jgi:crotonobetainyl-CoA:carnitine CoA-transferase CaiB-like acyl-CoA transferase
MVSGKRPTRCGNANPNIVPYQVIETADGYIVIAVGNDAQYKRMCEVAGRMDLWEDERYQTNASRVAHRDELVPQWERVFRARPTAEWVQALNGHNIPAGPINDIPEALSNPQVIARQMVQTVEHPKVGAIPVIGPVPKMSETPARISKAPPMLGEHTDEILRNELHYSDDEIGVLRREGAIGARVE